MASVRDQITKHATQAIKGKVFPGCVVGMVNRDGVREVFPFGNFTYEKSSPAVTENSIYDVASITKSIPTGSIALQLLDEGRIQLTDKLIDYLPEFNNSDRENVLIKHLLTYTLDGYGFSSLNEKDPKKLKEMILARDFERRPGTVFKYSNTPSTLLGFALENITGETLDQLADERFFKPLKMNRTTFSPQKFSLEEIVPTEIDDWRGLVHGVVHDESAYIFKQGEKVVGHAGLFSTAPDILTFLEMLLNRGTFKGKQYFSKEIVAQMGVNQIAELNDYTGLGWELYQERYMGKYATSHTFGKTGFTGTLCVCDVAKGIAYVILSNRIFPKRPSDSTAINTFRKMIGEIILK